MLIKKLQKAKVQITFAKMKKAKILLSAFQLLTKKYIYLTKLSIIFCTGKIALECSIVGPATQTVL